MTNDIPAPAALARPHAASAPELPARDAALDLTRASITLLVIAHHAVLAYHRYAPPAGAFTRDNLVWGAFPVVDTARAPVVDAFTLWNDSFFMAMMFLLAGLFVPASLARKGAGRFVRDRLIRLGLPFVVSAAVLAPLAYAPAYLLRAEATGHPGFWPAWRALGIWPAGPAWFLWVLLVFSGVAAAVWKVAPGAREKLAAVGTWCRERPARACVVLGASAVVAYLPTLGWVSAFSWFTWGPFTVQTGRVALYAVYFLFGCALGAGGRGISEVWMASTGPLARRCKTWQVFAGVVFVVFVAALIAYFVSRGQDQPQPLAGVAATILFAVTGVVTTFGVLAGFARWGHQTNAITASLTRSAFGMYLVHYPIVTWLQFALLGAALPGFVKVMLVTILAIGASWGATLLLRRLPGVARVI
jgi:peptidoglycan/LPS O-acetylase OafA/YrhL